VVGGGDATIRSDGPHSVAALADQVRANGVGRMLGALVVDETRHDGQRRASGWQDWQMSTYTGPLSALMVQRNRWRTDPAFLADQRWNRSPSRSPLALQDRAVVACDNATLVSGDPQDGVPTTRVRRPGLGPQGLGWTGSSTTG
jgi:D-alanyl-D-alanine carboxypeptidase